mgnify:CR=1 FL=1
MEQLYLEFDKEEFEKKLKLFENIKEDFKKNIQKEKFQGYDYKREVLAPIEKALVEFADRYIKGEIDLPIFLQLINYTKKHNLFWEEKEILPVVLKIKDYHEKRNEKIDINIYELLIYIYYYYYNDKDNLYKLSKELLSIDKENKIAKIILALYEEVEYKKPTKNFSIYDLAILYNKGLFYMNNEKYKDIDKSANYLQDFININQVDRDIKYENEEVYFWKETRNYYHPNIGLIEYNLGKLHHIKYKEDKDIKNYEKAEKFYKESISDCVDVNLILWMYKKGIREYDGSNFVDENGNKMDNFFIDKNEFLKIFNQSVIGMDNFFIDKNGNKIKVKDGIIWDENGKELEYYIDDYYFCKPILGIYQEGYDFTHIIREEIDKYKKDAIIDLANLYYEEKEYKISLKLIDTCSNLLTKDFYYYRVKGWNTYKVNECEETAKESLEYLKKSIIEFNSIDYNLFESAIKDAFTTIKLMYRMQKRGHIDYNAAKESLNELYIYNLEKPDFNLHALSVAFDIENYELCSKIANKIIKNIKNYNIDYKKVLKYLTISLHKLNKDNSKNLLDIFNNEDFKNYEYIIKLINECAGIEVLNKSVKIKDKKVLIDIYEIMSVSRKELIVIRLFDYVRNADGYANIKIDKETKEKKISKIARWKGETVKINYKENEYILCYHFHTSSEVQFKDGKSIKFSKDGSNNRIKNIRRLPAENWIAINQIRDTLAHRINENDTDVNEAVRTTKKAREFIEANFTSIIECLFNVIKENGLLTDDKFNSEDF